MRMFDLRHISLLTDTNYDVKGTVHAKINIMSSFTAFSVNKLNKNK